VSALGPTLSNSQEIPPSADGIPANLDSSEARTIEWRGPDPAFATLERDFPEIPKGETLPDAELANHVRYQALFRLRMGTE
jgi:hypothetical protein